MADLETPAAKRLRFTSPLVTIRVGADAEVFTAHEADLKEHSPFFEAALDAKWREGQTRVVALPDDEPDVVATYLDWLSSKQVPLYWLPSDEPNYTLLFKLYILGDKIKDDAFCDHVLSVVFRGLDRENSQSELVSPTPRDINFLYENTLLSCPLRPLVAKDHAERFCEDWFGDCSPSDGTYDDCPKEFFFDMIREITRLRGKPKVEKWYDRRDQYLRKK